MIQFYKLYERPETKAIICYEEVMRESQDPFKNATGGDYNEVAFIFVDENGKKFISYQTSADFEFCSLFGIYTKCENCHYGLGTWFNPCQVCLQRCEDLENNLNRWIKCLHEYDKCQHPKAIWVSWQGRSYRALPIEED